MSRPRFIAIDPAFTNGKSAAAYRIGGPNNTRVIYTRKFSSQNRLEVDDVLRTAREIGCTDLLIEKPYLADNPKTFGRLVEACTTIRFTAQALKFEIHEVYAATWQPAVLTVNRYMPKKRAERKAHAIFVACNLLRLHDSIDDDEADAACMLFYAENHTYELTGQT